MSGDLAVDVHFVDGDAQFAQRLADLFGVPDDDDHGPVRIDVARGDALDVLPGDAADVLPIAIEVVVRQIVQLHVEQPAGHVARALHGRREHTHQVIPGVVELKLFDVAGADAAQLR